MRKKVEDLEKVLHEMAGKIVDLEIKVKEMESKETKSMKIKEAPNKVVDAKTVSYQKESKDLKDKKTKLKGSVLKFGAEAIHTVSDEGISKEEKKSSKYFKCDHCDYKSE